MLRLDKVTTSTQNKATCSGDGSGRHSGLKIRCPKGRAGSNPALSTKEYQLVTVAEKRRNLRNWRFTFTKKAHTRHIQEFLVDICCGTT